MIKIYDGRKEFYQWDLNRKLIIDDSTVTEVHFCNKTGDCSLVVEVKDGGIVDVPNILLQTDWNINVYLYCGDLYTKEHAVFKVNKRTKPDDYVYTETEVKRWETLADEIAKTLNECKKLENDVETCLKDAVVAVKDANAVMKDTAEAIEKIYIVDNHEKRITNIERHISNDYFTTEKAIGYNNTIPSNACPYAEINKIGGISYNSNNILPFPYGSKTGVYSGVTVTVNADRSITFNGTATEWGIFYICDDKIFLRNGAAVSLGATLPSGASFSADINYNDGVEDYADNVVIVDSGEQSGYLLSYVYEDGTSYLSLTGITFKSGTVFKNLTIYPMIIDGITPAQYEDYYSGLRDTKVTELLSVDTGDSCYIPEAIQALDGYGKGINGYSNYIDFDRKVFVQNVGEITLNGSENWQKSGASGATRFKFSMNGYNNPYVIDTKTSTPAISNYYDYVSVSASNNVRQYNKSFSFGSNTLFVFDKDIQSIDVWLKKLKNNPLTIVYALAEPIVTDISQYIDNDTFIQVYGGGTIRAINEYNKPAFTEITYLLKEGSI